MSKTETGDKMFNETNRADPSLPAGTDPLPWLIHSLREKQADHSSGKQTNTLTEPRKDSP